MSYSRNEIVLLPIPFTDLSSRKVRPAVVIGHVAPITSQLQNAAVPLQDWSAAGLNVPCGIKSQIATIEDRLVVKVIGKLSLHDQAVIDSSLRGWLKL